VRVCMCACVCVCVRSLHTNRCKNAGVSVHKNTLCKHSPSQYVTHINDLSHTHIHTHTGTQKCTHLPSIRHVARPAAVAPWGFHTHKHTLANMHARTRTHKHTHTPRINTHLPSMPYVDAPQENMRPSLLRMRVCCSPPLMRATLDIEVTCVCVCVSLCVCVCVCVHVCMSVRVCVHVCVYLRLLMCAACAASADSSPPLMYNVHNKIRSYGTWYVCVCVYACVRLCL
jgi:hypothetical protein